MDLTSRLRSAAPSHPVKYIFHRSSLDVGPTYRNFANWQFDKAKSLYRKNLLAHFGCVNAIEFSKNGNLLVSGGDDRRVLVWNVDKAVVSKEDPNVMQAEHLSNVFSLDFSCSSEKIFSAGNDDQVIVHDVATCAPLDYFVHEQPVYGISADPITDSVFCSACDDGRILIFDIRDSANEPFCVAKATSAFHSVMFHPLEPRLLVTANSKEGVCSWDVRMPKRVLVKYGIQNSNQCCMNARFNRLGNQILVLRRRLPPILYSTDSPSHLYQFNHRGYYNSCTMKSCSFGGLDDQYVLSGSDNFDLHLWKIPKPGSDQWVNKADMVLRGHRSIVNQVRFNYAHNLIASSGVEKIVKLWSPFPLPDEEGGKSPAVVVNESERRIYTPDDYVHLVMQAGQGQFMSLTYEAGRKTTREDSRMLAFFDALVQRDINGMSSEESDDLPETSYTNTVYTSPETTSTENEDEDSNPPTFRSLLLAEQELVNETYSVNDSHNDNQPVEVVPRISSLPNNVDENTTNSSHNGHAQSEGSEDLGSTNASSRQFNDHQNASATDTVPPSEDRDITANKITQLILQKEKESNRRKLLSKTTSSRVSSNRGQSSDTTSDSHDIPSNEEATTPSHSSSSRPLRVSTESSSRRKSTTSSYSSSRKEFRKQLLRARRREMLSAPVYDSSRNDPNSHSTTSTLETSYDRINDLMTRNQASQEISESSENSSSSSSSDSSSSDESKPSKNDIVSSGKGKKKVVTSNIKSRAIVSTDSSSSESDGAFLSCASVTNQAKNEAGSESSNPHSTNHGKEVKRKRRHPCKLKEACSALFRRYADPEMDSQRLVEGTIPYKRLRLQMSESASTSSTEITSTEHVPFKKITKQKDRNYRKPSPSASLNTPSDSGIDVSKEQEPCCSKSCEESSFKDTVEKLPEIVKSDNKNDLDSTVNNTDDLGFGGQIESDDSE